MLYKFTTFMPDADETVPDVLLDGTYNVVPTNRGMRGANSWYDYGVNSVTATAVGIFYARRVTKTNRLLVGTATEIFDRSGSTWTSVVPAAITVSTVNRWRWAQWGDLTFAGAKETQPLIFESTTATSIAAMPRYDVIDTVGEFLMIGNVVVSVTYTGVAPGEHPDRWWCSALSNPYDWTPSIATQCATGRLLDTPGPITAGKRLAEQFVFYKQRGIWVFNYEGPNFIWGAEFVSDAVGTFGQDCVVQVRYTHFFCGNDNFYHFDGRTLRPIGEGIREWFYGRLKRDLAHQIIGVHDEFNSLIYWWYPGPGEPANMVESGGDLNEFVVYNYETNKWGVGIATMQAAHSFYADQLTWDQLWLSLTFDDIPNVRYDFANYLPEQYIPIFVNGNKRLSTLAGPHRDGRINTNWFGADDRASLLKRVQMRWIRKPDATCTPYRMMVQGEGEEQGLPIDMLDQSRFDFTQDARWHRLQLDTVGNWESPGCMPVVVPAGEE